MRFLTSIQFLKKIHYYCRYIDYFYKYFYLYKIKRRIIIIEYYHVNFNFRELNYNVFFKLVLSQFFMRTNNEIDSI